MLTTAAVAFAAFFATIGPIDVAVMYAALAAGASPAQRRAMAVRGTALAGAILIVFALAGEPLLRLLGITLPALRTAGGILLLLIGIDMVFARDSGGTSTTAAESREAKRRHDLSVFPLATPLIAGPGAIGASILLIADAEGDVLAEAVVIGMLVLVLLVQLACLLAASYLNQLLGVTGMHVIARVFGVLLCALAVQFVFDGIAASGLTGAVVQSAPALPQ
ncbi:MAG: NAAT family transporter [Gammaproteobacteria bacterium]|nr:NAAT family transporter [Gammaproteobacteria bacterium]